MSRASCRRCPPASSRNSCGSTTSFVTATQHDAYSNALVEALSCGLPAIYLDSGGSGEAVQDAGFGFNDREEIPALLERLRRRVRGAAGADLAPDPRRDRRTDTFDIARLGRLRPASNERARGLGASCRSSCAAAVGAGGRLSQLFLVGEGGLGDRRGAARRGRPRAARSASRSPALAAVGGARGSRSSTAATSRSSTTPTDGRLDAPRRDDVLPRPSRDAGHARVRRARSSARAACTRASHRVQVSHREIEELVLSSGIDPAKVFRIPIGIEPRLFGPDRRGRAARGAARPPARTRSSSARSRRTASAGTRDSSRSRSRGPTCSSRRSPRCASGCPELHVLLSGPARGYVQAGLERARHSVRAPARRAVRGDRLALRGARRLRRPVAAGGRAERRARGDGGRACRSSRRASARPWISSATARTAGSSTSRTSRRSSTGSPRSRTVSPTSPRGRSRARNRRRRTRTQPQLPLWRAFFEGLRGVVSVPVDRSRAGPARAQRARLARLIGAAVAPLARDRAHCAAPGRDRRLVRRRRDARRGRVVFGGAVKFQLLDRSFPNAPRDFNVLYLGSSSMPLEARTLVRLARGEARRSCGIRTASRTAAGTATAGSS